jgi:hypothetical protein
VRGEVSVLRSRDEIEPLRADWETLAVLPEQNWDLYWNAIHHQTPAPTPYVVALSSDARLEAALAGRIERGAVTLQLGYWKLLGVPVRRIVIPMQGLLGRDDED